MISKFTIATSASALIVGAALVLTGCSSGTSGSSASSQPKSSSSPQGQGVDAGGAGGFGGATTGQIAQVSGSTLQVQSSSSQTAVDFTASTTITKTVDVQLSAVTVGECITATTTPASGSSGSTSAAADGPVATVAISKPTNGSCTSGFGGFGGRGGTQATPRPSARPSVRPSGSASGRFGGGNFTIPTSGKVTAVSGSTITVDALDFQMQKTSSKTVTVGSSTKYTEEQSGAASDLTVGQCVVARGKADDTGAVAATAITVSAPVNGSCTTGFFGGARPGAGQGGNAQSGTSNG